MGGRSSLKVRKRPSASLTLKQERFVAEFGKDLNASAAARRAGYSVKTARSIGQENLTKPAIWAAIQQAHQQANTDAVMSGQEILEELTIIGRTDVTAFHGENGQPIPVSKWTPQMGRQVSKLEVVKKNVAAGDGHTDTVLKLSTWDKMKALETLAKYRGIATTKIDLNVRLEDQKALESARPRIALAAKVRAEFQAKHPELLAPRSRRPRETEAVEGEPVDGEIVE